MRVDQLKELLQANPFIPFRINLTNGQSYEVKHRGFITLTRDYLYVGVQEKEAGVVFDRVVLVQLLHIVSIEPLSREKSTVA